MIGRLGSTELLIIFGVVLVVFGPSKLPELGRSLGRGIREFRQATHGLKESIEVEVEDPDKEEL
ncbi:twin-arginine translocase TatA/TatE family subunit [Candidatus Contubernalis alkaliaceticus]|uniref:twin-arginine translocase TatA/TatE family subunit n=1 Tax=Candidatus Contubernalis alkaliaceticus TaxID=338645 RepID=UPI001F4C1D24|nr:twin-arginine translocase TatA/TatE family subunit [Candidatus Contubernalis alkalaceticus]UNC92629.1 twin-arginine translocase TatA/TatE family subunit [Candidatus Contubernalis alkalaceticus]